MTASATLKTASDVLTLDYTLDELPSSQHRAGLAGLVLMCKWLERQPERAGICELTCPDGRSARLRIDPPGLAALFDEVYGAELVETERKAPFKGKEPKRIEEREEVEPEPEAGKTGKAGKAGKTGKTGKPKTRTVYIYDQVLPRGAYLESWAPGGDSKGIWIKLWRDMIWSIMRGVPATRAPFEARAQGTPDKLVDETWRALARPEASVDLPSTYFLGAQATTAESVRFRDRGRFQFLLHFWPFAAPIYVPAVLDNDGKRQFRGYALAIPDVAELEDYCDTFERAMRDERNAEVVGYRPAQAVVDVAAESALDFMARLANRLQGAEQRHEDLVHAIDVFHVEKVGNNVRVLATARVAPEFDVGWYRALRDSYRDFLFRRQRLLNFLANQPWHSGFDRILCTTPVKTTIENTWFRRDVRRAFKELESGDSMTSEHEETEHEKTEQPEPDLQSLIYRIIGNYINGKLDSKYSMKWKGDVAELAEDDKRRTEYNKTRLKIAKDAFLAVRSRTGTDFVDYFSGTLCAVPYKLDEARYAVLARALLDSEQHETLRTLTLLALSARA